MPFFRNMIKGTFPAWISGESRSSSTRVTTDVIQRSRGEEGWHKDPKQRAHFATECRRIFFLQSTISTRGLLLLSLFLSSSSSPTQLSASPSHSPTTSRLSPTLSSTPLSPFFRSTWSLLVLSSRLSPLSPSPPLHRLNSSKTSSVSTLTSAYFRMAVRDFRNDTQISTMNADLGLPYFQQHS